VQWSRVKGFSLTPSSTLNSLGPIASNNRLWLESSLRRFPSLQVSTEKRTLVGNPGSGTGDRDGERRRRKGSTMARERNPILLLAWFHIAFRLAPVSRCT